MAGGEEKKVENKIKKYLDSLGAYYLKVHGSAYQPAGTPDILVSVNGKFVGIEVKKPVGGVVSDLQKHHISRIEKSGGVAFVARSVDDVKRELKENKII